MNASKSFLNMVLDSIPKLENDFEVKKFTIGLTSLLQPMNLPDAF